MTSVRPPQFQSTFSVRNKRLRFAATSAGPSTITDVNFLQLLQVAVTTISGRSIAAGFRLRSVEIWGPMSSSLAPVAVAVEFQSNNAVQFTAPSRVFSDSSMGMIGAHVRAVPTKGSYAATWLGNQDVNVMVLSYPAGAIIDITFDLVIADGQALDTSSTTLVGATVGDVFVNELDGATGNLVPVSYLAK